MPDTSEPRTVAAAADQAASGGGSASAERLLCRALSLRGARHGPHHTDLADTPDRLGVVSDLSQLG